MEDDTVEGSETSLAGKPEDHENTAKDSNQSVDHKKDDCSCVVSQNLEELPLLSRPSTPTTLFCRICHERNLPAERNISPCSCKGTLALVHQSCLQEWLVASDSNRCELCGHVFQVKRIPKFSLAKSLWHWFNQQGSFVERQYVAKNTLNLILDLPLVFTANWLWFTKADHLLQFMEELTDRLLPYSHGSAFYNECLAVAGQMLNLMILCPFGILTGSHLMLYVFQLFEHARQWYTWHRRQTILIINIAKANEESRPTK